MKVYKIAISTIIGISLFFGACKKIDQAESAARVGNYSVNINALSQISTITSTEGLKIVFENFTEGFRMEKVLTGASTPIDGLIPGLYSINILGRVTDSIGETYYLSGSKINFALVKNGEDIEIPVNGLKVSPLVFSEIYYCGSAPFYFRDQYYEIYNNSSEVIYLDGIHFANLTPTKTTTILPLWPSTDAGKYAYAERVWKIPGTGMQYPLTPGESFVISQFAANHKLPQYNSASPIDGSGSEFEFNMDNPNFPNQPAVDMQHVFYNGSASKGSGTQFLTSVFGGAYVIFRVPEGETYDPVNNLDLQTKNLASSLTAIYAKVPIHYVLDAVEAGDNENAIAAKRVPAVLDAGMTYVGANYISVGVARKVLAKDDDGSVILMDTNNSTEDFERGVVPMFRRHGAKIPAWSHSKN